MKVIVEPRFPVRGILSGPISKPTRLDLSPMQIKRCLLADAKVYEEIEGGKRKEISLSNLIGYDRKAYAETSKLKSHPQAEDYHHAVAPVSTEIKKEEVAGVEKKEAHQQQVPVDPYKGMTKAERRRARREAEQKAAEEAAKAASLDEVSTEPAMEEVASAVEESAVEEAVEQVAKEPTAKEEKVEE